MNILAYNWRDLAHPRAGGAEVYLQSVAREWVRSGHDVTIFCAAVDGHPEHDEWEGIHLVRRSLVALGSWEGVGLAFALVAGLGSGMETIALVSWYVALACSSRPECPRRALCSVLSWTPCKVSSRTWR